LNKAETAQLLTVISQLDNRKLEPATVEAWHAVLGHLDYSIAVEAARVHFRDSTDYLMPAHIVAGTKRIQDRLDREERRHTQAIEMKEITFDRAEFDRQVAEAIEFYREQKNV
jgi:hypothetical protein